MTSIIKRILGGRKQAGDSQKEAFVEDDKVSDIPYIASSIFYLSVILFIGLPVWFYTCSTTRYSLPNLTKLENKLINADNSPPKLHLDISVIQLSRYDALKADDDSNQSHDQQTNYLRTHLPNHLDTSIENVTYNIKWRVRRPTRDENRIFQLHLKEHVTSNGTINQEALVNLELNLVEIHKPTNRFRLFMYLIEEPYYSAFCDSSRSHTYTISFERFVYLCPSNALSSNNNYGSVVNLIGSAMDEVYSSTVDIRKIKHILGTRMDVLISLLPESSSSDNLNTLSTLANQVHHIYNKNVNDRFSELKEIVNIRLITQNVIDLIDGKLLNRIIKKPSNKIANANATFTGTSTTTNESRIIQVDKIGQLFHNFESRLNGHFSQNVHNVLFIVPDPKEPPMIFRQKSNSEVLSKLNILEGQDLNSMFVANDDKSLVLTLRAIVRRISGLSSANICKSCLVRRDVFFNRWEIDAIMGVLTLTKLQNTLISLKSISQQNVGVKIPKDVSKMASEAHDLALKSIEHLETKGTLESYRLVSKAYELSEAAFYDPSLLESLYFPDDLKYAIYLPLFLPLALPFSMSVIRLFKFLHRHFRHRRNQKLKIN